MSMRALLVLLDAPLRGGVLLISTVGILYSVKRGNQKCQLCWVASQTLSFAFELTVEFSPI